jgi:hypothetical protein
MCQHAFTHRLEIQDWESGRGLVSSAVHCTTWATLLHTMSAAKHMLVAGHSRPCRRTASDRAPSLCIGSADIDF